MRLTTAILFCHAVFAGCTSREPAAITFHEDLAPQAVANRPANLVLGPTAVHARFGPWFAARSDWPAVEYGLRLEDVSTFSDVTYDDQAYYDRHGGAFFKIQDSARTGILLR